MEVDAFREHFSSYEDAIIVFRELGSGIKIGGDLLPGDSA